MRASPQDVTVITVAANSGEALLRWRDSWTPTGCRLLVADNGSSDGMPGRAGVPLVRTGGNPGFGAGVNAAAEACSTGLVLITNPDTLPANPGSVSELLAFHREGTLSGAALVDGAGNPTPSGGRWPAVPWVAAQVFLRAGPLWKPDRVEWIQGALILAERELFQKGLQGFHPDFPLYFEDVDLCARARAAGVGVEFCAHVPFTHVQGTGAPSATAVRLGCFHWGMWRWFVHHRPGNAPLVRRLILMKCAFRSALRERGSPEREGYAIARSSVRSGTAPVLPNL